MKNLYFGLLSVLLGTILWFSFVKGDIIDSDWNFSGKSVLEDVLDGGGSENKDKIYVDPPGYCKNSVICFFSQSIWFDIVDLVRNIAVFLVCLLLLMILSVFPLYNIFEKLGEKWSKSLIPIKNLYCLANLVKTRKFGVIWWGLSILWRFFVSYFVYIFSPCLIVLDFNWEVYRGSNSITCWLNNMLYIISYLPVIIVFLTYIYFALISFYRLFRKFGWNRWSSLLWTIFFPIWACVLWFGNFECQWENL